MMHIQRRTSELIKKYPDKPHLFEAYMRSQLLEYDELEQDIMGATILLRKNDMRKKFCLQISKDYYRMKDI